MAGPQFVVNLEPKDVASAIDIGVRKALVEALGAADHNKLAEAVVNAAMSEQSQGSGYGKRRSLFADEVDKLIREEAKLAVAAELEALRPILRDVLKAKIKHALDPLAVADSLTTAFFEALSRSMYTQVTTNIDFGKGDPG
jgi:hypothetical protein